MAAKSQAGGYTFHTIGFGSQAQSDAGVQLKFGPLLTLQQVMERLGHTNRTIDIFKMDCEGCEFDVLPDQVFLPMRNRELTIRQLSVEMHTNDFGTPFMQLAAFFEAADAAGLRIYHKERNGWGCKGFMVRESFL